MWGFRRSRREERGEREGRGKEEEGGGRENRVFLTFWMVKGRASDAPAP